MATYLVHYAQDALAGALANLVVTLDPAIILIGGAFTAADVAFFDSLRDRLSKQLAHYGAIPTLAPAQAGARGAVTGAMALGSPG